MPIAIIRTHGGTVNAHKQGVYKFISLWLASFYFRLSCKLSLAGGLAEAGA
jgi:hypothetical protein